MDELWPQPRPRTPAAYDREADRERNLRDAETARVRRCEVWGVDPSHPEHERLCREARDRHRCRPEVVEAADQRIARCIAEAAARKAGRKARTVATAFDDEEA